MNKATVNIIVQIVCGCVNTCLYSSWVNIYEIIGSLIRYMFSFIKNCQTFFPKDRTILHARDRGDFQLLHIFSNLSAC